MNASNIQKCAYHAASTAQDKTTMELSQDTVSIFPLSARLSLRFKFLAISLKTEAYLEKKNVQNIKFCYRKYTPCMLSIGNCKKSCIHPWIQNMRQLLYILAVICRRKLCQYIFQCNCNSCSFKRYWQHITL